MVLLKIERKIRNHLKESATLGTYQAQEENSYEK